MANFDVTVRNAEPAEVKKLAEKLGTKYYESKLDTGEMFAWCYVDICGLQICVNSVRFLKDRDLRPALVEA